GTMSLKSSEVVLSKAPTPMGRVLCAIFSLFTASCLLAPASCAEVIRLFNGRDLAGLSTWLKDTKHDDPRRVFRVTDGVLHITGDGFGYVATRQAYRDYHLVVEYRRGRKPDRGRVVRNSGTRLHATGP